MGFLDLGYKSYEHYLASNQFSEVRRTAWEHSRKHCAICGKKWELEPHHLSYKNIGKRGEWKDIRFLCRHHHRMVHFVLWIFKIPLKPQFLKSRYYFVKIRRLVIKGSWETALWLRRSYKIEKSARAQRPYR